MRVLAGIAGVVFILFGGVAALNAFFASAGAETIMHQIYAGLYCITAAVLLVGGMLLICLDAIVKGAGGSGGEVAKELQILRVKLSDGLEKLEELAADATWFKDLEVKKIARAKAAAGAAKKA